jgi:microcystin-dependent protein/cytoskeletal protein CcmA (bactofilin family)
MPYIVNFTDKDNKLPITVYDNTSSTDTSLTFPGRNVTGYGQTIAENFLALLENFAKETQPVNPVEGQLWYNTTDGVLQLWDSTAWKAASNIQKGGVEPSTEQSKVGELWVDTTNQQLYVYSGTRWILVGPNFSTGLRSGPIVESITDSDNVSRVILIFYIEDIPVIIFSKDSFTPKLSLSGFITIKSGLNITENNIGLGGFDTKIYGAATSAESLIVSDVEIPAAKFLRSDIINTTEFGINVRNNQGVTIGVNGTFSLTTSDVASRIYDSTPGGSIDLQINNDGIPSTVLRVIGNTVGINVLSPDEALHVDGNIKTNGSLILTGTTASSNFNNGTFRTAGGAAITKNLIVGDGLKVTGVSEFDNTQPAATDFYDSGTVLKRWKNVRTKNLIAETIEGVLTGNIVGNASTATNLKFTSTFKMEGDVTAPSFTFDGQVGGNTKTFTTTLTSTLISSKDEPFPLISTPQDTVLVFRPSIGLIKETRNTFVADLAVPIGAILPYAGAEAPYGYILCDGSELEQTKYSDLYDVIGTTYNGAVALNGINTFKVPDLRGRFPLGKDNMDNAFTVPNSSGGFIDAGGGNVDRVSGTAPDNLGDNGGQSSNTLTVLNLPDHEHNMKGSTGQQYFATRVDSAIPSDVGSFSEKGPTTVGQSQYIPSSGGIKTSGTLGQEFSVINPFLTLNYIIHSGPPAF